MVSLDSGGNQLLKRVVDHLLTVGSGRGPWSTVLWAGLPALDPHRSLGPCGNVSWPSGWGGPLAGEKCCCCLQAETGV